LYDVASERIYVMSRVFDDPASTARLDSMLAGMGRGRDDVIVLDDEQLPGVIAERQWVGDSRQGAAAIQSDPDIIFSAFTWPTREQKAALVQGQLYKDCLAAFKMLGGPISYIGPRVAQAALGSIDFYHYERRPEWNPETVCWSLHDIHSAWGCLHRCAYCTRGDVYVIMLNIEEFVDHVDTLLDANPWQKVIRYDVEQDVLPLEPEYGASKMLVEHFAELDDRYLILFSKSANVDFLLPLDHKGHTIMLWTLTPATVSRDIEPRTGTMEERIEAARKCQEAGYPVRFKCKPVVPKKNWRAETTHMFETLFAAVKPENISMELLFFQGGTDEMDKVMGFDTFPPEIVEACKRAEAESDTWNRARHGMPPFPFEVVREVYHHFIGEVRRLSPDTPITLCAETQRMWEELADLLPCKPWDYVCNCGPHCAPGLCTIDHVEGPDAPRIAAARAAGRIPPKAEGV